MTKDAATRIQSSSDKTGRNTDFKERVQSAAADSRKFVWVLEEKNHPVKYPLPYVTDYYQYEFDNMEDIRKISDILEYQVNNPYTQISKYNEVKQRCPHQSCNAEFRLWNRYQQQISCPVCKQELF